jgi:hypothetical protein
VSTGYEAGCVPELDLCLYRESSSRPLSRTIHILVSIPTELSWLRIDQFVSHSNDAERATSNERNGAIRLGKQKERAIKSGKWLKNMCTAVAAPQINTTELNRRLILLFN